MKTKVSKIKIKDSLGIIDYQEINADSKIAKITKESPYLITDDLKNALAAFKTHLAKICDLREGDSIKDMADHDIDALKEITVSSVIISGSDESEGVVIVGQKTIGNKVMNLISPFTKFTDEHEPYEFEHALYEAAVHLAYEAELYLFEGKVAVKQLEMFGGEENEDLE